MRIVDKARITEGLTFGALNDGKFLCGSHNGSFASGEQSGRELIATESRTGREAQGSSRRSDGTRKLRQNIRKS